MWIITRNKHQALAKDGTWTHRSNKNVLRLFDCYDTAVEWIEHQSIPREFVSMSSLESVIVEEHLRNEEEQEGERERLRHCQYVPLRQPLVFKRRRVVDDDWVFPVFDRFEVTHSVLCEGSVVGVFGTTSSDDMEAYCYTLEEYHFAFEQCYERAKADSSISPNDEDG